MNCKRWIHLHTAVLAVILLAPAPQAAWAATCTAQSPGMAFGNYDPFVSMPTDGVGALTIRCDELTDYSITLSTGNGSYLVRTMAGPGSNLEYNLYTDASRTVVWGDGSGGSMEVHGQALDMVHYVYGRIPARQNVRVGVYADVITVLVAF